MSKINFPKKQEQRLIPKYLLEYSEELVKNHPDPSESWGGGSGGSYTAGTGIDIENKVISVDNTVAMKTDIPDVSDFVTSTELSTELEDYELKEDAFSGSYSDLSNKPDLSVYELKEDAFTGDYDDLTNKPDLSVYELAADAFSGDYNDLTNKPTIPDAVSGTNDGTNWTTITIGNTTKAIPAGGGTTYTAGTWIGITNDIINVSNPYISLIDSNNLPRVMISDHTNGTTPSFGNAKYCNISPLGFGINDRTKSQPTGGPSSNAYTYYNWDKITFDGTWDLALPTKSGTIALTSDIPTVPTNISAFTNDSGYITGITSSMVTTALGYTPGTSNFSGSYNDLTNKPNLSIYAQTANLGTAAFIDEDSLSIDYSQLTNTPTIPVVPTNVSSFTNDAGYITGITSTDVTTALGYTPGTSNFSGSYNDLTNKPTIPDAVSGTNDGTNWTSLTIGNDTYGLASGGGSSYTAGTGIDITNNEISIDNTVALKTDIPSNYVTTTTAQEITGEKGFAGNKLIRFFDDASINNKMGFTCYHSAYTANPTSSNENGYLESVYSDTDLSRSPSMILGMYNNTNISKDRYLGFKYYSNNSGIANQCNLVVPTKRTESTIRYIPVSINGQFANNKGEVTVAVPTAATSTSTSTVTPTTVQLTFTYTDDTTETITLMTGASVSTTTNTTLS